MSSTLVRIALLVALFTTSVFGHTALNFPTPRTPKRDYAFTQSDNACESTKTSQTEPTVFKRGQSINPSWWWNNHSGGFVKFAIVKGHGANIDNKVFLENKNIIGAQCYTGGCDKKGFDKGFTHLCKGKAMAIPDWLPDGDFTLQFSQIGGFDSDGIPTKLLPLYHNCANIKIQGGSPLKPQPKDWIAPFTGGSQDTIKGKTGGNGVCGFKEFRAEPADPSKVNTNKDVKVNNMQFGTPDGWAVAGKTNQKRVDALRLPRLGHVARTRINASEKRDENSVEAEDEDGHFEPANDEGSEDEQ